MRRQEFITLVSGAVAWPLTSRAQQSALPVIGYLNSYSHASSAGLQRFGALKQGLAGAGFVDGKNIAIEVRSAEGHYDRLPLMAADLARRQVKVIVAASTPAALAAKAATTTILVVFTLASDPVALGLVDSRARSRGNLTGVTRHIVELVPKKMDLLHQLIPAATSIALLVNPTNPAIAEPERATGEAAVRKLGLQLHVLEASDERGIDEAFTTVLRLRADALVISADSFFVLQLANLAALSLRHRVPTLYFYREFVVAGGLMSYFRRSSRFVSYRWNLLRPDPEGRQAGRPTGPAVNQDRDVHQSQVRAGARPHHSAWHSRWPTR